MMTAKTRIVVQTTALRPGDVVTGPDDKPWTVDQVRPDDTRQGGWSVRFVHNFPDGSGVQSRTSLVLGIDWWEARR